MAPLQPALSGKVILNELSRVAPAAAVRAGGESKGILNVLDVAEVSPGLVKLMLAPVTAPVADAVKFVKVATPATPFLLVVPPIVQVVDPATALAVTVATLAVTLPN